MSQTQAKDTAYTGKQPFAATAKQLLMFFSVDKLKGIVKLLKSGEKPGAIARAMNLPRDVIVGARVELHKRLAPQIARWKAQQELREAEKELLQPGDRGLSSRQLQRIANKEIAKIAARREAREARRAEKKAQATQGATSLGSVATAPGEASYGHDEGGR